MPNISNDLIQAGNDRLQVPEVFNTLEQTRAGETASIDAELSQYDATRQAEKDAPRKEKSATKVLDNLGQTRTVAPGVEEYDYATAAESGWDGTAMPDGNIYLPNNQYTPGSRTVGGQDLATGEQVKASEMDLAQQDIDRQKYVENFGIMNPVEWGLTRFGEWLSEGEALTPDLTPAREIPNTPAGALDAAGFLAGKGLAAAFGTESDTQLADEPERLRSGFRAISSGFHRLARDVNALVNLTPLAMVYEFDESMDDLVPNLGGFERLGAAVTEYAGLYSMASPVVMANKALAAKGVLTREVVKDFMAVFGMDPDETLVANWMVDKGYLDPEVMNDPIMARLYAATGDAAAAGAVTSGVIQTWKGMKYMATDFDAKAGAVRLALTKLGDDLIEAGNRNIRQGLTTLNSGIPIDPVKGVAQEAAGTAVNAASAVARRLMALETGLEQAATGYVTKGGSYADFAADYAKVGDEPARKAAWDNAQAGAEEAASRGMAPGGVGTTAQTREAVKAIEALPGETPLRKRSLQDLQEKIPPPTRAVKETLPGDPVKPRTADEWDEMDLAKAGEGGGSLLREGVPERLTREAIEESGPVAQQVVDELAAKGRTFMAKPRDFWEKAFRLPARARYWYEVSATKFQEYFPDLNADQLKKLISVVAATSVRANPFDNIRRAVAGYAQDLQGKPIDIDLTIVPNVRDALSKGELEGLKTGSFGGTMQYLLGMTDNVPLSTNDVQVASSFGVTGEDIAQNPVLYEVLSRWYQKARNLVNEGHNPKAEPWETWQIQSAGWVRERVDLDPTSTGDDYWMALDNDVSEGPKRGVIQLLEDAGIPVPGGKLTNSVLMDPRVPEALRPSVKKFRGSDIITMEANTLHTPSQAKAAGLRQVAVDQGDDVAVREYDRNLVRTVSAFDKALATDLATAIHGKKIPVTRVEIPTFAEPYSVSGSWEGQMAPNVRIPVTGMSGEEIESMLTILAKGLKQDGVPASTYTTIDPVVGRTGGQTPTFSVFIKTDENLGASPDLWSEFSNALPDGFEISVNKHANGYNIDVVPRFAGNTQIGPTRQEIDDAIAKVLPSHQTLAYERDFKSYFEGQGSDAADKLTERVFNDAIERAKLIAPGVRRPTLAKYLRGEKAGLGELTKRDQGRLNTVRSTWQKRSRGISEAESKIAEIHGELEQATDAWLKKYGNRLEARQASPPAGPFDIEKLKTPRGEIGNQGVTSEGVLAVLREVGGMKLKDGTPMKELLEQLKNSPGAQEKLRKHNAENPIDVQSLPDGSFHLKDGHHRAFILDQIGDTQVNAIVR